MTNSGKAADNSNDTAGADEKTQKAAVDKPDWADGLKQFYDSVVDEPLPDELTELLSRFDDGDSE